MFHKTIDVAKIMREIKNKVIIAQGLNIYGDYDEPFNRRIIKIFNDLSTINASIQNKRYEVEPLMSVGDRIPVFSSFPSWSRKFLITIQRIVRKSILFMSRDQTVVNYAFRDCVKGWGEYSNQNLEILSLISELHNENLKLKKDLINNNRLISNLEKEIVDLKKVK